MTPAPPGVRPRFALDRARDVAMGSALAVAVRVLLQWERLRSGVAFNPLAAVVDDPYPLLNELRERDPVHWSYVLRAWLLTRHADVNQFLRDAEVSKVMRHARRRGPLSDPYLEGGYDEVPSMLILDPPEHTRLRMLVSQAFTPRAVAAMQPRIESIVAALLDAIEKEQEFDLIAALAYPLPVIVICELLGVPADDRDRFKTWSDDIANALEYDPSGRRVRAAARASNALGEYLAQLVAQRRIARRDDLVSALIVAEVDGGRLSAGELVSTLRLLLVAGNETTTNLIGNGMLALLRHPEQLERLRNEPSLLPNSMDEMLRYDPPVQAVRRIAMREFELGGRRIRRGDAVACLLGAANRDPATFRSPDTFDVTRDDARHVSFGFGAHYCLGAALARLEAAVAFRMLLARFPHVELATSRLPWRDMRGLRGLERLPLRVA